MKAFYYICKWHVCAAYFSARYELGSPYSNSIVMQNITDYNLRDWDFGLLFTYVIHSVDADMFELCVICL
jgi:hypothetical protein